jgi:predicted alpha/beta superfamily hydrolase
VASGKQESEAIPLPKTSAGSEKSGPFSFYGSSSPSFPLANRTDRTDREKDSRRFSEIFLWLG